MSQKISKITPPYKILSDEVESLRELIVEHNFNRGEVLSSVSEISNNLIIIRQGSAKAYYVKSGRDITYDFAFDNEILNVPLSLLNSSDTEVGVRFLEPTICYFLAKSQIASIITTSDNERMNLILNNIIMSLLSHAELLQERLLMFQSMNAEERYNWILTRYPQLLERVTITELASFLCMSRETLYRIRSNKYNLNSTNDKFGNKL